MKTSTIQRLRKEKKDISAAIIKANRWKKSCQRDLKNKNIDFEKAKACKVIINVQDDKLRLLKKQLKKINHLILKLSKKR